MADMLFEAMAARCAIASVNGGDLNSIVSEGNREFIFASDDGPAFAAAATRWLGNSKKRDAPGAEKRRRVVTEFSRERMFSSYCGVFSTGRGP